MSKDVDNDGSRPVGTGNKRSRNGSPALDSLRLVGPGDMAELMGVSKRLIFRWRAAGKLPPYDFAEGQTRRWQFTTVAAWIEQRKKAS